ncbi:MAG: helix-turn-helix domain-containing protein [Alphaproteobacteria bacterium]
MIKNTPYGPATAIQKADELHAVIATQLITDKPFLSGGEFRFLRKELNLSQNNLARLMGKDVQSIARWEKSGRVSKMADRFLRAIYYAKMTKQPDVEQLLNELNELEQQHPEKLFFEHGKNWRIAS